MIPTFPQIEPPMFNADGLRKPRCHAAVTYSLVKHFPDVLIMQMARLTNLAVPITTIVRCPLEFNAAETFACNGVAGAGSHRYTLCAAILHLPQDDSLPGAGGAYNPPMCMWPVSFLLEFHCACSACRPLHHLCTPAYTLVAMQRSPHHS